MANKSLDALLDEAAAKCDELVAELDQRIPNHPSGAEHPTEAQIAVIVAQHVNGGTLAELEGAIEASVRSRMKTKGWEYTVPKKK